MGNLGQDGPRVPASERESPLPLDLYLSWMTPFRSRLGAAPACKLPKRGEGDQERVKKYVLRSGEWR